MSIWDFLEYFVARHFSKAKKWKIESAASFSAARESYDSTTYRCFRELCGVRSELFGSDIGRHRSSHRLDFLRVWSASENTAKMLRRKKESKCWQRFRYADGGVPSNSLSWQVKVKMVATFWIKRKFRWMEPGQKIFWFSSFKKSTKKNRVKFLIRYEYRATFPRIEGDNEVPIGSLDPHWIFQKKGHTIRGEQS